MIEKIRCVLGSIIGIFVAVFGMYLFSILPKILVTLPQFMTLAGAICSLVGGAFLLVRCLINFIEG